MIESLLKIIEITSTEMTEFIISDNSDEPLELKCFKDNVKIVRPTKTLNMTDHWNFLFEHASGSFLTFIGDDDAFIPSALEKLCVYLKQTNCDLVWTPNAGYVWPNGAVEGNYFQIKEKRSNLKSLESARAQILRLDPSCRIPIPYNSAVVSKKLILDYIRDNPKERFFSSRIPDINAGVKILFLARSQAEFNETTFVSGSSSLSNGLLTRSDKNHEVTREFQSSTFNPISSREGSWISEVHPFGFITFYEAIEESILQLGYRFKCKSSKIAFKSVFHSSYPKEQLDISIRTWPHLKLTIRIAYLAKRLSTVRGYSYIVSIFEKARMGIKAISGRTTLIIIRGPGISDTDKLVAFLENTINKKVEKGFLQKYVAH